MLPPAPGPLAEDWPERAQAILRDQPDLATERLRLRRLRADDAAAMYSYAKDPEVARYMSWSPHASLEDSRGFLATVLDAYSKGVSAHWGIEDRATGRLLGTIGFTVDPGDRSAEAGYVITRDVWGRGYVTEALHAVIAFGIGRLGLHRMIARCAPENVGSWKVMKKAGMRFEGIQRGILPKGAFGDLMVWSILRTDPK